MSTISTHNNHLQRISSTSSSRLNFNTSTLLTPVDKQYICFLKEGKFDQAARCIKSRIITKVIDYVISIDTFEQQYVVLKGMLQSPRLKYHVHTIGIYPSLRNNAIYEHKCLENIERLYLQAGKREDQIQFKNILEADMVSNPEGFTENSPIYSMMPTPVKKPSD